MMMMIKFNELKVVTLTVVLGLSLAACSASREKTLDLSLGMSEEEVVSILGKPESATASEDKGKCYVYSFWKDFWEREIDNNKDRYYACFMGGSLNTYGMMDDTNLGHLPK